MVSSQPAVLKPGGLPEEVVVAAAFVSKPLFSLEATQVLYSLLVATGARAPAEDRVAVLPCTTRTDSRIRRTGRCLGLSIPVLINKMQSKLYSSTAIVLSGIALNNVTRQLYFLYTCEYFGNIPGCSGSDDPKAVEYYPLNTIHLMTGPLGNSGICPSAILNVPRDESQLFVP